MSDNDQKLISDHKEVIEIIRQRDKINLINTSGEPVDEYDIEYKIKGYSRGADGTIKVNTRHRIKIKLPFGYPHFHPTVKPLSPIFHPDIDDHAIRIAHYWEKNKSLPGLIKHIGNMICGKEFSTENPFNKDAAGYYENNRNDLPLDTLENPVVKKETRPRKEPIQFNFIEPLIKIVAFTVIIALAGGGGLFFYEKSKLGGTSKVFDKAKTYAQDQDYKRAETTAQQALETLKGYYLLKSASSSLQQDINAFLQSKSMQKGLQGKIKFGDQYLNIEIVHKLEVLQQFAMKARKYAQRSNLAAAIEEYEKALEYASKNNLQDHVADIKGGLAGLKLDELVSASEQAHESKNWDWAIQQHEKVINYIKNERQFLGDVDKQLSRTKHLLLIDQIALHSKYALQAEEKNRLEEAIDNYNTLISLISKSSSKNNAALKSTLGDARQKVALLKEKLNLKKRRQWLLDNYKEIFQVHYPTILVPALRSPQAVFVKYNGKNPVFDLNCLEKSQGSVVRLRLYYQYNPDTGEWSVFDGDI